MTAQGNLAAVWSEAVESTSQEAARWLLDRLAAGDSEALAQVYRHHHESVRAFARRLLGDDAIAEDLVHDVFLAAPSAFRRFRGEAEVRTLLLSIAVNKSKQRVRSAVRARRMLERLGREPSGGGPRDPEEDVAGRRLREDLQRALDQLPLEQRVVVVLCAVEERTAAEVSAIVGAPENTVRSRLFHGKRRLRELLGGAP